MRGRRKHDMLMNSHCEYPSTDFAMARAGGVVHASSVRLRCSFVGEIADGRSAGRRGHGLMKLGFCVIAARAQQANLTRERKTPAQIARSARATYVWVLPYCR